MAEVEVIAVPQTRQPRPGSPYYLEPAAFEITKNYALSYQRWSREYASLDGRTAVQMDGMPKGTRTGHPTEDVGGRRALLKERLDLVEEAAREAAPEIYRWLLDAVTHYGRGYVYLSTRDDPIPCGRHYFYKRRRRFFFLLYGKIDQRL